MFHQKTIRASWLFAGALLFSASAFAQDGKGEVAAFGGGIGLSNGGGTHALFGGSAGVRVVDHLHIFGEFSLIPLASDSLSSSGVSVSGSDKLYNFGGGVDYGFGSSKRAVPYVLLAAGVGHEAASVTVSAGGSSSTASIGSSNSIYTAFGGGVRIYAGNNWGFKPEFRFQSYINSAGTSYAGVFTAGLFFQFGQ